LYDWVVEKCEMPHIPHQYEFGRLNITNTIMSKRYLKKLVESKLVKGYDDQRMPTLAGLRRRGYSSDKIREIQNIYRILYQKNYNNTQAVQIIEAEMEATPERDEILQFIRDSQRGIMKGYFSTN
jgi:glutamyl/glutaminyl-tRNA synthetase